MTTPKSLLKHNKTLLSCLVIGVLTPVSSNTFADTVDSIISDFSAGASAYRDNTGTRIKDTGIAYEYGKKHVIKGKVEVHHYKARGETGNDDHYGHEVLGTITKDFNDYIKTEVSVGSVDFKNDRTKKHTRLTKHKAKITFTPHHTVKLAAEHKKDFLFKEAIVTDDSNKLVSAKTSKVSARWRAHDRLLVKGSSQQRKLSDDNRSKKHDAAVLYRLSSSHNPAKVWTGVEAQSQTYDKSKSNYWSPEDYQSYALVIKSKLPVTERLNLTANASINRSKQKDFESVTGGAVKLGANYALTQKTQLKAHASHVESSRKATNWNSSKVGMSFTVSDF
ncbi:MAG: hypothetical protein KAG28_00875 [Cocleimonas sp.]|nr:hypothetical protein [Cocleimonas sp.]